MYMCDSNVHQLLPLRQTGTKTSAYQELHKTRLTPANCGSPHVET